jgi:CRISPR type I-E-associated protein CasB/Cse2
MPDLAPIADIKPPGTQLSDWLCGLVRKHNLGALAALRRPNPPRRTEAHHIAAAFAPSDEQQQMYLFTAFLFARYHAGALRPHNGYGDIGTAMRKIGSGAGRGPADPGAKRLLDRITASREIPWRHLQHAIERARACDTIPPSWAQLPEDLARWNSRDRLKSRDRSVADAWGASFYTPTYTKRTTT